MHLSVRWRATPHTHIHVHARASLLLYIYNFSWSYSERITRNSIEGGCYRTSSGSTAASLHSTPPYSVCSFLIIPTRRSEMIGDRVEVRWQAKPFAAKVAKEHGLKLLGDRKRRRGEEKKSVRGGWLPELRLPQRATLHQTWR